MNEILLFIRIINLVILIIELILLIKINKRKNKYIKELEEFNAELYDRVQDTYEEYKEMRDKEFRENLRHYNQQFIDIVDKLTEPIKYDSEAKAYIHDLVYPTIKVETIEKKVIK